MRAKLEDNKVDVKKSKSNADKKADELLDRLNNENNSNNNNNNGNNNPQVDSDSGIYNKLSTQIQQADDIISSKDHVINQLEQKLLVQSNQRERAEIRCGTSISEMEAMKADMITLAKQLQLSESRSQKLAQAMTEKQVKSVISSGTINSSTVMNLVAPTVTQVAVVDDKEIIKLQKISKFKDEKIQNYRKIIIKLKEEFIKGEEEKAMSQATSKSKKKVSPYITIFIFLLFHVTLFLIV
jgi:hypothetical protein